MRTLPAMLMLVVIAYAIPARADATADAMVAAQADERQDYATELKLLQPLAEQGEALAQFNLGVMYMVGRGFQKMIRKPPAGFVRQLSKETPTHKSFSGPFTLKVAVS